MLSMRISVRLTHSCHFMHNTRYLWIYGAVFLWAVFCTYWYMCIIKGVCATANAPVVSTIPRPTSQETWDAVSVEPLLVYFAANGDDILLSEVESSLKNIATYMKEHPSAQIAITGHTNMHKDDAFTVQLGKDRAEKVKELLVMYGATPSSIYTYSRGQYVLAAPVTTPENQALNRRAVISIIRN